MRFSDFLPPILTRAFLRDAGGERKDLSGSIDFLPGMAAFLNPEEPTYRTARSYEKMAQDGYGANAYLYRGVRLIAETIAGIPWRVYAERPRGRTPVDGHPAAHFLNTAANDEDSGPEFVEALVSYWLLSGTGYVWAVRPETGQRAPTRLFAIQPNLLRADVAKDGTLTGWVYEVGGVKQTFNPEDVLHLKDFHPLSRGRGMGAATVASRAIDQLNSANDWNTAVLQNMARPSGLLTPKTDAIIPPDVHESLREELRTRYSGTRNAGRPLVPRAPMQWQPMGQTATEMDWLAGKRQAAKEIAVALGVPPVLLEDHDNATYNNLKEAQKALLTQTCLPRMDRMKAAFTRFLLPMYGLDPAVYALDYNRDDIEALQEDRDAMHARVRADYAGGVLTLNRALELIGEEPAQHGDFYLAPPRAMTVDQLLEGAGLPPLPDGGVQAHAPAVPPPGAPPMPKPPQPPGTPPGTPAGTPAAPGGKSRGPKAKARAADGAGGDGAGGDRVAGRDAAQGAVRAQVGGQFDRERGDLTRILREADTAGTDPAEAVRRVLAGVDEGAWRDLLASSLAAVGARAGSRLYNDFAAQAGLSVGDARGSVGGYDAGAGALADALATVPAARALDVTATTRATLSDALNAVVADGSYDDLVAAVGGAYDAWGDWRADAIAGDWTVLADELGAYDGADQFLGDAPPGFAVQRTWMTVGDAKVRPEHAAADGQTVGLDEPFDVGGESLMYPGDPSGSAANTANCRCSLDYSLG